MPLTSDLANTPDSGSPTQRTGKRTWAFHERYSSDPEFKRQIDEGRKRANDAGVQQLKDALATNRQTKLY